MFLENSSLWARDVILIENRSSIDEGILVKTILTKKFHLPDELISLRQINEGCEKKSEALIHLCIDQFGELHISKMNYYVVNNSLGIFINQNEAEED